MTDPTQTVRRTYTHPDVLGIGVREGWADPETDPTRIDWPPRQAAAAIPFKVINGRPVNPREDTAIWHGRNECGHWGEALAADALVTATDQDGRYWCVMVERDDGHGWALPGGHVEPNELPSDAAVRELAEEAGLHLGHVKKGLFAPVASVEVGVPRYVPDPRASREAWMVTVLCWAHLGAYVSRGDFPPLVAGDDAARAVWARADTYDDLSTFIATAYSGEIFAAHRPMLADALG